MTRVKELPNTHGGQAVRGLSFAPSDAKFCSCADDGTVRIWDWELFKEERILAGHGWDVKTCDWHPTYKLLASGSKDNQAGTRVRVPLVPRRPPKKTPRSSSGTRASARARPRSTATSTRS